VTANGAVSDSSTVDVAALSREFQSQVEQWRTRTVTADSTQPVDTVPSAGMARDSVQ
jgi:hypothetical protein